jgi:simple sugar transport system permease protein|uniref:ABC transporter permease n=1 Tax=Candidatus Planktophila sp. TaxID=2175601 RepID=UPI00404A004D
MIKKILDKTQLPLLAFFLALFVGGLVIGFTENKVLAKISSPIEFLKIFGSTVGNAYLALFQGAIYDPNLAEGKSFMAGFYPLSETMVATAPLILCGLSVALAFKSGLFNIGAQGQFIFGAIGASYIGFKFEIPVAMHILVATLAGVILAALWGGIVGLLKAKTGAHEVIVTIMLNYIAAKFLLFLLSTKYFLRPGRLDPIAPPVKESAKLPNLFGVDYRVNIGIFIALAASVFIWWLLNRSIIGFRFRAVGANSSAARTAGISVSAAMIATMAISGGLAGMGGAIHTLGNQYELTDTVAASFGFDAITVALLGRGTPLGVVLASLLFAGLRTGGQTMQANVGVPVEIVLVIQALVVLFIAAPALVKSIFRVRNLQEASAMASKGWNG